MPENINSARCVQVIVCTVPDALYSAPSYDAELRTWISVLRSVLKKRSKMRIVDVNLRRIT